MEQANLVQAINKSPTVKPSVNLVKVTSEAIKKPSSPPSEQVGQPLVKLLFVAAVIFFLVNK